MVDEGHMFGMMEDPIPPADIGDRVKSLQDKLGEMSMDGAFLLRKENLYYFGSIVQMGLIYVPCEGVPIYFVKKGFERTSHATQLKVVKYSRYSQIPEMLCVAGYDVPGRIGLEMDVMPVKLYRHFTSLFPDSEFGSISTTLLHLQMIKSDFEVEQIKKASGVIDGAMRNVPELLGPGMSELELLVQLEKELRLAGSNGIVRSHGWDQEFVLGVVLGGRTAELSSYIESVFGGRGLSNAAPIGSSSTKKLVSGEPIVIDMVASRNGYYADMTRTFCIGSLPAVVMDAYRWCLDVQDEILNKLAIGETFSSVTRWVFERARMDGYENNFMGVGDAGVSFIGHGVGLVLDSYPIIYGGWKGGILAGMVFAIEPKIMLPNIGAVGVENTYYVRDVGGRLSLEQLTTTPEFL